MIICIANQKGGVGKTTTALNISAGLAFMGHSTLLVDTDPQAHCTLSYVQDPYQHEKSLYDVLTGNDQNVESIIIKSTIPGLDIGISRISMAKLESSLLGEIDGHFRMKDVLAGVKKKYEFIIIDTPPNLGLITLNALVSADGIIIPIQSSFLCLEGTDDLLDTIEKVKRVANANLEVMGFVITLHDKRTNISKDVVARIKKSFGRKVFKTIISKSVKVEESPAYKESIFTYAPNTVGAIQYKQLAEEIISRAKTYQEKRIA